ncbi:hypothetical protein CRG98_028534 [Punica granatum]|uniref:Uncharacterized protein n=1 Tax=Punica granatum TaxID=22663 RepID=A0A2I0J4F5_PUNGR|nr:hypothetical protein CRG98_028534 [Punica granatum]
MERSLGPRWPDDHRVSGDHRASSHQSLGKHTHLPRPSNQTTRWCARHSHRGKSHCLLVNVGRPRTISCREVLVRSSMAMGYSPHARHLLPGAPHQRRADVLCHFSVRGPFPPVGPQAHFSAPILRAPLAHATNPGDTTQTATRRELMVIREERDRLHHELVEARVLTTGFSTSIPYSPTRKNGRGEPNRNLRVAPADPHKRTAHIFRGTLGISPTIDFTGCTSCLFRGPATTIDMRTTPQSAQAPPTTHDDTCVAALERNVTTLQGTINWMAADMARLM